MKHGHLTPLTSSLVDALTSATGNLDFLLRLQQWLVLHLARWPIEMQEAWQLDEYAQVDLSQFATQQTSLNPHEEIAQLLRFPPTSLDIFAMRISGIFWEGITVYIRVFCPRDCSVELKALHDQTANEPVMGCDVCTFTCTLDGRRWRYPGHKLSAATEEQLEQIWSQLL